MKSQRKMLREELNLLFKEKGILELRDKRRLVKAVLGTTPTFNAMKEDQFHAVINYVRAKSNEELRSPIIAWAYMVELEAGLTKKQIRDVMESIPSNVAVLPFSLNETSLPEANSTVIGVINDEFYDDYLEEIKQVLASVCNDWRNERADHLYVLSDGHQVMMNCDVETVDVLQNQTV